jgi:hypothetical protein
MDEMTNAYNAAINAIRDAEIQHVHDGGAEAQARAETDKPECPCCVGYGKPGNIWNAGAWMKCPMCNPGHVNFNR